MDYARFDRLAAALAAAPSRRGLLRLIPGGTLLAILARLDSSETAARRKRKKKCKSTAKKCGKRCIPKANCCTSAACPEGEVCRGGSCSDCVISDDCLAPSSCQQGACENGRCVFENISGGFTVCGVGACQRTVDRCIDGVEQPCVPGQPSAEMCNGIDDDCDGEIDDGAFCDIDSPATCGRTGVCAGGSCQLYGTQTVCRFASCVGETKQFEARCDGNGTCPPSQTQNCAPYRCSSNGLNCVGSCGGPDDCVFDHFCQLGQCIPRKGIGEPCTQSNQCLSNFCSTGVCCTTRCDEIGQTCPGGQCQG